VMEYVEGEDLHKKVRAKGALPVANACQLAFRRRKGCNTPTSRAWSTATFKPQNMLLRVRDVEAARLRLARRAERRATGDGA